LDLGFWWSWINPTLLRRLDSPRSIKTLGLGLCFCRFRFPHASLLFHNTVLLFTPLFMIKLLGKFYKFLYMFLLTFVLFLCILFTENLDEKYYCTFLLYFLNCLKIHENFVQILFQILDNCLWYMLDDFVGLLLLFVFDFTACMWILISYLACKALCS
jgi:hypothetical protein